ncbi:DHH family phosphoesterase [Natronosalvus rutilus]|uniref:DHH family phosphoesterase n=1 Tax=Natronosalvus rutilus TaxID=2953753 RepID=A0A9E7N7W8_9EURY|nr:DHH family phosphoesterase [Natronosalvus rutilus]UTF53342.1 DHH family phosphoesterase [Natronosalvus rutilus]
MISRLVLGCGDVGQRVVERQPDSAPPPLRSTAGSATRARDREKLFVVSRDADVVETLREENVRARQGEPSERSLLEGLELEFESGSPDLVFVASDDSGENRRTLETAREVFPDAIFVAYVGESESEADRRADRQAIERQATHVVDSIETVVEWVAERTVSQGAQKAIELRAHLSQITGTLAVIAHDNPDPDAIASAVALVELAESVGVEAEACYYGEISHQENRAMVNLLDLDLRTLEPTDSLEAYDAFALVDHSRPGVNDQLPADLDIDIVIDHHPPRGPVPGEFYDLRQRVGATSTVLTEYLEYFGIDVDSQIATALLYGIRVDTRDFTREISPPDFEAAATLWNAVDFATLRKIEYPTVEGDTLDTVARAIKNRVQRGSVIAASAGRITDRDALPQAADQLLAMDGVDTTLVFGFRDEMVFVSARSRGNDLDLGETLRDAFDQIGSAGGHADMAGAQLEMGVLGDMEESTERESILNIVEEVITDRFFEAVDTQPGTPVGIYSQTSEMLFGSSAILDEQIEADAERDG